MKGDRTWFVLYEDDTEGGRKFGQMSTVDFFRTMRGAKQAARIRKVRHPYIRKEILVGDGKWGLPKEKESAHLEAGVWVAGRTTP